MQQIKNGIQKLYIHYKYDLETNFGVKKDVSKTKTIVISFTKYFTHRD